MGHLDWVDMGIFFFSMFIGLVMAFGSLCYLLSSLLHKAIEIQARIRTELSGCLHFRESRGIYRVYDMRKYDNKEHYVHSLSRRRALSQQNNT